MSDLDLTSEAGMLAYLQHGKFPTCTAASRLSEGFSAFVYRVTLADPLEDGSMSVIVKHVQGYAARWPEFKIEQDRLTFEHDALAAFDSIKLGDGLLRLPKVYFFDEGAHVLGLEDLGSILTLKQWVTCDVDMEKCCDVGSRLGRFLARIHAVDRTQHPELFLQFDKNITGKQISALVYFGQLPDAAAAAGHEDEIIAKAAAEAKEEVLQSDEVLTMGDFWPGNVLIGDDEAAPFLVDFELVKPGTRAFDMGQMAAELYCLARFKDGQRGTAVLHNFLNSYKTACDGVQIDVGKVAIRVGAHLIVMGPRGWADFMTPDDSRALVAEGAALVVAGWKQDQQALQGSFLKNLYDG